MTTPAPTPQEKVLKRVLKVSRLNGWSVAVFAGLCVLLTLALGDLLGSIIGLLAVTSGWMEIRGHRQLQRRLRRFILRQRRLQFGEIAAAILGNSDHCCRLRVRERRAEDDERD